MQGTHSKACCNALRPSWTGTQWTETLLFLSKCRKRTAASRNTLALTLKTDTTDNNRTEKEKTNANASQN
jgi:hypothetical protein